MIRNVDYDTLQVCGSDGRWHAVGPGPDACAGSPAAGTVCADGSVYAGLSPDGNAKMFTTPADAGLFPWNSGQPDADGWVLTGQASTVTGAANTAALITIDADSLIGGTQPHLAAQYCADLTAHGRQDWYQPARDELNVLYTNRVAIGSFTLSGGWPSGYYWSSSEFGIYNPWFQNFGNGAQAHSSDKDNSSRVRCVRK